MTDTIKEQLTTLAALQKAELMITKIGKELSCVDARVTELGSQISASEEKVKAGLDTLDQLKKQYRDDEAEIKSLEDRIAKNDMKLRMVKTNKEYQSVLKEIDEIKRGSSAIEDRMISALDQIERAEGDLVSFKKELTVTKAEIEGQQAEIREKAGAKQSVLEDSQQERDLIWSKLDTKIQTLFNKVKIQGHGIAVAAIVEGVCQVCRINIPPQMFNDLLRLDSVRLCPNCQRIIYPKKLIEPEAQE